MQQAELDKLLGDATEYGKRMAAGGVAAITGVARKGTGDATPPQWTREEEDFIRVNVGLISEEEIGRQLAKINGGHVRSKIAVHQRRERDLQIQSPSKDPNYMTAQKVGYLLGIEGRKIVYWMETGLMPFEIVRVTDDSPRKIHRIYKQDLIAWLVDPENWIYFNIFRMKPGTNAYRMVHLRRQRLGWHWLTTRQVADMHRVDVKDVTRYIALGRIPRARLVKNYGTRNPGGGWAPWFVRSDDAVKLKFIRGRGRATEDPGWTPAANKFMLLSLAVGISEENVRVLRGDRSGFNWKFKLESLNRRRLLRPLAGEVGVELRKRNGEWMLFADWRQHKHRFKALSRAAGKFLAGQTLNHLEVLLIKRLIYWWGAWFAKTPEQRKYVETFKFAGSNFTLKTMRLRYSKLKSWGIDPFAISEQERKEVISNADPLRNSGRAQARRRRR